MKTARELFSGDSYWDYDPIIENMGTVALKERCGSYQGDFFVLYKGEGDQFGFIVFGYGSCSVCDVLQACNNTNDVQNLMDRLANDVQWKPRNEMIAYFKEKDWDLEWYGYSAERDDIIKEAIKIMEEHSVEG